MMRDASSTFSPRPRDRHALTSGLGAVLVIAQAILALGTLYHYFLLFAGRRPRQGERRVAASQHRLAVAIPAHNEGAVIGATVQALRAQVYAPARFDVHVVADHCTDDTALQAAAAGAVVHVRETGERGRKGYALAWLIDRLLADAAGYDAVVIFDADSRPAPDCLAAFDVRLLAGARAIQGRHVIANPDASYFARLADADMRLNNRLRNQAKRNLGLSARLMGDAMCLHRTVLERYPWAGAGSLTEDRDYGLQLVVAGQRIDYTSDAVSYGQSTAGWQAATPQRMRWYGGAFALQARYLPALVRRTLRRGDADALDKVLELALPSFSQLAVAAPVLWLVQRLAGRRGTGALWLTIAIWLFPVKGLLLEGAPLATYRALLVGPFYVLWRVWIALRVRLIGQGIAWVRTEHR